MAPVSRQSLSLPLELPLLTTVSPAAETRVTLRAFTAADVGLIQSAARDPLIPLITSVPSTGGRPEALAFIERQHRRLTSGTGWSFAVADASTGTAVGQIGLWPGQSSPGHHWVLDWAGSPKTRLCRCCTEAADGVGPDGGEDAAG